MLLWWVDLGQQQSTHTAAHSFSASPQWDGRENRNNESEKTHGSKQKLKTGWTDENLHHDQEALLGQWSMPTADTDSKPFCRFYMHFKCIWLWLSGIPVNLLHNKREEYCSSSLGWVLCQVQPGLGIWYEEGIHDYLWLPNCTWAESKASESLLPAGLACTYTITWEIDTADLKNVICISQCVLWINQAYNLGLWILLDDKSALS